MIKNFKKELELISSNDRISEKLMIFSLYNEFYNSILGTADDYFIEHYAPFMEKTFELVASSMNLQENLNLNAEQFMRVYFQLLKKSRMSAMPQAKGTVEYFENELNYFIERMGYVEVIEHFDSIPLNSKVDIMTQFREFINNMFRTTIELYDEESSKGLRHNILDMLTNKLRQYLNDSLNQEINTVNICSNLKPMMMTSTKEYLMEKLRNDEFGFNGIKEEEARDFFASFSELEQKIWLMGAIYGIAGYDKNDKSKEDEKIAEMCELLDISILKYTRTAISMAFRSIKIMRKAMKETEIETLDGEYTKKRRK